MLCARVFNNRCHAGDRSVYGGSLDSTTALPEAQVEEQDNALSCIGGPCPSKRARRNVKKTTKVRCTIANKSCGSSVYRRSSASRRPLGALNQHDGHRKLKEPKPVASCWPSTQDTSCSLGVGLMALSPWRQEVFKQTIPSEILGNSQYSHTGSLNNLSLASRASRVGRLGIRGEVKLNIMATTDGKMKVQVSEAKDLRHSGEKNSPVVFTEVSVRRGGTCLRSYVTNILEATHPVFNESLHVDIEGCDDHHTRLVIGIVELRTTGKVMIGCMSFGVRHLKRKAVCGWYYLLNDELGMRKHLRLKNTMAATSPQADQPQGHRYQKNPRNTHVQTGADGTPRKNVLERVAIYNRQKGNAAAKDHAWERRALGRYDSTGHVIAGSSSIGRRISNHHVGRTASPAEITNSQAVKTPTSRNISRPESQIYFTPTPLNGSVSLRDVEKSIPMTLDDLQVDKDIDEFGCNAHGTVNMPGKSVSKSSSTGTLVPSAADLPGRNKHRTFLPHHRADVNGYLQDRLISLLCQDREFYDSAPSSSASSSGHQSDYDSADEVASRTTAATTSDSEQRWECLAAFDNFSGGRSTTGSEISSAADLHNNGSDDDSSLAESQEWQEMIVQLERERQEYARKATMKHMQSLRRLHSLGYISTPKPQLVLLTGNEC